MNRTVVAIGGIVLALCGGAATAIAAMGFYMVTQRTSHSVPPDGAALAAALVTGIPALYSLCRGLHLVVLAARGRPIT